MGMFSVVIYYKLLQDRQRCYEKGSKISNKDGAWTSSLVLWAETAALGADYSEGEKNQRWPDWKRKCWSKSVFPALYLWVTVNRTCRLVCLLVWANKWGWWWWCHKAVEATNQSWCPEILLQPVCGAGMEQVISRCCGCHISEPVQEQTGQVLAKIWALKAWLSHHGSVC